MKTLLILSGIMLITGCFWIGRSPLWQVPVGEYRTTPPPERVLDLYDRPESTDIWTQC